jgi:cytochrome c peroxidase
MRGGCHGLIGAGLFCAAGAAALISAIGNGRSLAQSLAQSSAPPPAAIALAQGANPHPVTLLRPVVGPLSAMAQLGKAVFFDVSLSSSGRLSCASCHSPEHAYGPPGDLPAMKGGPELSRQGARAVPTLMYLESQPSFSIGPDNEENENVSLAQSAALGQETVRLEKTAAQPSAAAVNLVPQGGLFWDGRADTLQNQALSPLLDPREMDGGSVEAAAKKLRQSPYARRFVDLFGAAAWDDANFAISEALFAVARYQIEDQSFHPYSSKFDDWLEGKARFATDELRGYLLFNEPAKANCAGCHVDQPSRDGLPPLFTDHQFEALGAPRNAALEMNGDQGFFDLGICGPYRADMAQQTQYCGLFATPTLRNVMTRQVFFHNGVFHSLKQVLDFYNFRDTDPQRIYPRRADGTVAKFNDLPQTYQANVDVTDPPFNRHIGEMAAMTAQDEDDIIAFLRTLIDARSDDGKTDHRQ